MILSCFEFPICREKFIGQGTRSVINRRKVTLNGELPGPDLTLRCSII